MANNEDEKVIQEILQKGMELKAPHDLNMKILKRWKLEEETLSYSTPIFPKLIWWIYLACFASLFVWGFSKMAFSGFSSKRVVWIDQGFQNVTYFILESEQIIVPSVVVFLVLVIVNIILMRYRLLQRGILG